MEIIKKLELAAQLKRDMDCAIDMLMKRDGLTRAAAVNKVILSPEVTQAHRLEREQLKKKIQHGNAVSGAADKAIEDLAKQHRAKHPEMTHAQCVRSCRDSDRRRQAAPRGKQAREPAQSNANKLTRVCRLGRTGGSRMTATLTSALTR